MYKNKSPLIIFPLLFLVLIILGSNNYYFARGDYYTPINPFAEIISLLNIYNFNLYGGFDWSFKTAELPIYIFYSIFSFLKPIHAFYLLIVSILFFTYFGVYKLLSEYSEINNGNTTIKLLSYIYCFSTYLTALAPPGHYHAYIFYAISPWILYYLRKPIRDNSLKIFLIFFISSPGFGNVAFLVLFILVLLIHIILNNKNLKKEIYNIIKIYIILFLSNLYWILPYLLNISEAINLNMSSLSTLSSSYKVATQNATILNILLGVPENMFYMENIYIKFIDFKIYALISTPLILLLVLSINNSTKLLFCYLIILLLLMKGGTFPFPNILEFLFDNFPIAKIIRRPLSKLWGIYFLVLILIIAIKYGHTNRKIIKYYLFILSFTSLLLFTFNNNWSGSNLPNVYNRINTIIGDNEAFRVLLLPGSKGTNPIYIRNNQIYHNYDYINIILKSASIRPDITDITLENNYKNNIRKFYSNNDICENLKLNSINYILYDTNIVVDRFEIEIARNYTSDKNLKLLLNDDGVFLYKVNDLCSRPIYDNIKQLKLSEFKFSNILVGNNIPSYTNFAINNNFKNFTFNNLVLVIYYPTLICILILFSYIILLFTYAIKNILSTMSRNN